MADIDEVVKVWKEYCDSITDWQELVKNVEPKDTYCGPVYEMPNPIPNRPNEDFAVVDMRNVKVASPHYHTNRTSEIYFVIAGEGLAVHGGIEDKIQKGSVVVTPPNTTHYAIPTKDLMIVAINTPPFKPENCIEISETSEEFKFDKDQYERLTKDL